MTEPLPAAPLPAAAATVGGVRVPRVFISYAHDCDTHRETVRDLWIFLRAHGVDARIDRVAAEQRTDWTLWMERQVTEADRILIIASRAYRKRAGHEADPGGGAGVQYEARLIRNLFYQDQSALHRFLPVVLPGGSPDDLPAFLTPAVATVYRVSAFTVAGAETLLRVLHDRPGEVEPTLGPVPDLPTRGHTFSAATVSSTGSLLTSLVQNTPARPRAGAIAPTPEPDSEEEPLASGVRGLVDGVREALADGAVGQADRLTTLALLEQAGRAGCLRWADAAKITDGLLAELDDGWASASGGRWGFRAQRSRLAALVLSGRRPLQDICLALGWRTGLDDVVPLYAEFVRNTKEDTTPFYPTLRNPDREHDPQWHDEWTTTVLALHKRVRDWGG